MWIKTYAYAQAKKRTNYPGMGKREIYLKKIRRWEEELSYASPKRAATLVGKIARLKTRF